MSPLAQRIGVNHDRAHVLMAKKLLDGADVVACLEQMRGEAVAERATPDMLEYSSSADGFLHGPLKNCLMDVLAAFLSGLLVLPPLLLREHLMTIRLLRAAAGMTPAQSLAELIEQLSPPTPGGGEGPLGEAIESALVWEASMDGTSRPMRCPETAVGHSPALSVSEVSRRLSMVAAWIVAPV